jgi:hypothetical protein
MLRPMDPPGALDLGKRSSSTDSVRCPGAGERYRLTTVFDNRNGLVFEAVSLPGTDLKLGQYALPWMTRGEASAPKPLP